MDTSSEVQRRIAKLELKSYSSVDLMNFTSDFLESNKIGSGGCGKVYKGQLPNSILIAVKVLENIDVVKDTFMAEVDTMGNTRHLNLIKLYGYCFEDNMKALVYEYMENGSLDKFLYENDHGNIEWVNLYDIAIGIANGLKYLHLDLEVPIIHYDIKAANVLLDKNFSAKLADFGLAMTMKRDVSRVDVSTIRGTYGYMAPEIYNQGFQASRKCDVYNFGMMLFEILGKRSNGVGQNWFPRIIWNKFENGNLEHYITTYCGTVEMDKENANILCKVALWCVQENPGLRPSMKNVVLMLEKERQVEDPPCPSLDFRELSNEMELHSTYPQNIISSQTHASVAGSDDGVTMPQRKSNKRKTRSPIREEDLATLVPNKGMKLPTTKLVGKTTALKYKEIILQLIAKDEVVTIGVHGMGGVGKTTIFKHVHNQLLAEGKRFDKVIWVTVSKDANITKLQDYLSIELGLELSHEDTELRRSSLLLQALEKRKRVVFFFDDMWTKISLDKIGIPEPTKENGFKLILTTRLLDVCRRMGCHKDNIIKVEGLPKDEAWELLMNKIDCVLTPKVEKIVEMVAKKCFGLPLAIITIGGAMRGNSNLNDWTIALNDLNLKDPSNRNMGMEDDVYECLKFSYDRLENEKQRKCFLCCALYPEDSKIKASVLLNFWIMDGIVEGRNKHDELVQGQYILNKLKGHCLLETVYNKHKGNEVIKMHDSIREMALRLTNKFFLVKGPGLKELPNEEEWEVDLERASFMQTEIVDVSISPICPKLSTLILRDRGNYLMSLRHDFFVHMKCLKVLDLRYYYGYYGYNNHLELLPDSISNLVNLRALLIGLYKKLKKLPSLAKLVLLRRLELNDTGIEELPEGIEKLVNLRCLILQKFKLKERIPIGLISKFPLLRELDLGRIKVDKLYESGECFAKELLSLKQLENLSVTFRCLSDYCSYVGSPKFKELNCFYLGIGSEDFFLGEPPRENTIYICNPPDENIALVFPKNTKLVHIRECNLLKNVFPSSRLLQLLRNLKKIRIWHCCELEDLVGDDEEEETKTPIAIPRLTYLELLDLPKLKRIWRGVMICDSLERIGVRKCSELRRLPRIMGEEELTPPQALKRIIGSNKWWDSLEWDPLYPKSILQPFFKGNPIE